MTKLAAQDRSREKGESRTRALLCDHFWVLKRSVDIEGGDFLVQRPADSLEELYERKATLEVLGVVQAKYFANGNQVRISRKYVEDDKGRARTDFFALLHTDAGGEEICYFFKAEDMQKAFTLSDDGEDYLFRLTTTRAYEAFRNLAKTDILKTIEQEMLRTEIERNKELVRMIWSSPRIAVRHQGVTHTVVQDGPYYEIRKTDPISGTTVVVSRALGNAQEADYDPISETTSVRSKSL